MTLVELGKFKEDPVLTEICPLPNEKGEIVEVQVLEEGEVFDPDAFLDQLKQPTSMPSMSSKHEIWKHPGSGGENFDYYRCSTQCWDTKCYVNCPADEVREYLRHVEKQTHPYYKTIDPACFRFEFDLSLLLATSHSVNNPERLYLKCPAHTFKFFQWINQTPKGMAKDILTERS